MIPDNNDDDDDERVDDSSLLAAESSSTIRMMGIHHLLRLLRVHHLLGLLRVHQLLRVQQLLRRHQLQIKRHSGCSPQQLGIQARNIDHLANMMIIFECIVCGTYFKREDDVMM